jgi:hypothetical protein
VKVKVATVALVGFAGPVLMTGNEGALAATNSWLARVAPVRTTAVATRPATSVAVVVDPNSSLFIGFLPAGSGAGESE